MNNHAATQTERVLSSLIILTFILFLGEQRILADVISWHKLVEYDEATKTVFFEFDHAGKIVTLHNGPKTNTVNEVVWLAVDRGGEGVRIEKHKAGKDEEEIQILFGSQETIYRIDDACLSKANVSSDLEFAVVLGRISRILSWPTNLIYQSVGADMLVLCDQEPLALLQIDASAQQIVGANLTANAISTRVQISFEDYFQRQGLRLPKIWNYAWSNSEVKAEGRLLIRSYYLDTNGCESLFDLKGLRESIQEKMAASIRRDAGSRIPKRSLTKEGEEELTRAWHLLQEDLKRIDQQHKNSPIELKNAQEELLQRWNERINEIFAAFRLNDEQRR